MEMDIIQLISNVGFPIAACIGMALFVKYNIDKNDATVRELQTEHKEEMKEVVSEIKQMREEHDREMKEVTTALNNNTIAIQRLTDKLGSE